MVLPIFAIACCTTKPPRNFGEVTHEGPNARAGHLFHLAAVFEAKLLISGFPSVAVKTPGYSGMMELKSFAGMIVVEYNA
jgi:hypothetical protein